MNIKVKNEDLGRMTVSEFKGSEKLPIHVILDNVRSAQNVGSLFRTMDAFRCTKLHLCGICAVPPHREINKTALGATETVDWEHYESTVEIIKALKKLGVKVYAIEQTSDAISLENFTPEPSEHIALIFGNEVDGVSQEAIDLVDGCIEIPQYGSKHSFNVSVCAGITLWQATTLHRKELDVST
jgi:tRNA G18 (ribose-2'-O)-methylase SpoU